MRSKRERTLHVSCAACSNTCWRRLSTGYENMSEAQEQAPNQIKWSIHDSHPDVVEVVRNKLGEVVDPEIGMNIIQLGLVRDVSIDDGIAHLKMVLTTPFCPYGPAMIEMTREKAVEALDKPVTVEMLADVWDFAMMEDPSALDWGMYA